MLFYNYEQREHYKQRLAKNSRQVIEDKIMFYLIIV